MINPQTNIFYRPEQLRDIEDCCMVGIFPEEDDFDIVYKHDTNMKIVETDGGPVIAFYIKALCNDPEKAIEMGLSEPPLWLGRSNMSFKPGLLQPSFFTAGSPEAQLEILKEKLSGKVILFKPKLTLSRAGTNYFKHIIIIDILNDKAYEDDSYYFPIPRPAFATKEKFEAALYERKEIRFPRHNNEMMGPELVFFDNNIYIFDEDGWIKGSSKHSRIYNKADEIIKLSKPESFEENVITVDDHLVFVDAKYKEMLKKYSDQIVQEKDTGKTSASEPEKEASASSVGVEKNEVDSGVKAENEAEVNKSEQVNLSKDNQSEQLFLQRLEQMAVHENLYYDRTDLYNFHVSVKTNSLTVLAGMSGTGKTRLAELYAKALNLGRDENYIIVPITPSYTEPADILGFLNFTTGIYSPTETGLVDLLLRAKDNPEQIFMVIFDEMNLSQIEHWFSPFISILEIEEKNLHLYAKEAICHNRHQYPAQIPVYNNIIFVGTVNVDETTKDFSDRLLDRANLIKLRQLTFREIREKTKNLAQNSSIDEAIIASPVETMAAMPFSAYFLKWIQKVEKPFLIYTEEEIAFLEELHKLVNHFDVQKGVSLRIFRDIEEYIANISRLNTGELCFPRQLAIDFQIKQRVMSKLRGHEEQFGDLIGKCETALYDDISGSELKQLLDKYSGKVSDFAESKNELIRKARSMFFNGYTV